MRRSVTSLPVLAVMLAVFAWPSIAFGVASPNTSFRAAVIRSSPFPGVRLNSGLTVCDEEFRNGRLLSRYWGSNGQIVPDAHLANEHSVMDMLPVDAFKLSIEGQELSGTWKWIRADKKEVKDPDGLLVTIELESTARPIRVKVNTVLSGGPVMVRWIEVE